MQRIISLAVTRSPVALRAWKRGPARGEQPAAHRQGPGMCARPARPFTGLPGRRLCKRRFAFPCQKHRPFSSEEGPPGIPAGGPAVSVVGIPDPITWVRCRVLMYLVDLHFGFDIEEFEKGVKQVNKPPSSSSGPGFGPRLRPSVQRQIPQSSGDCVQRDDRLRPDEVRVSQRGSATAARRHHGRHRIRAAGRRVRRLRQTRQFCDVAMRFWLLSTYEGPDDPEGTKIFQVAPSGDGGPQRRIVTAVYEFHRELTRGASPDWTVTTVWHWHWEAAE
ncbi:m-AAA protease-interacting protein 1, mitochondrial isoform X1 [Gasterosteus aculeatus]